MRNVVVVDKTSGSGVAGLDKLLGAANIYLDMVADAGYERCHLTQAALLPGAGVEKIVLWDHTDQPGALGYHDDPGGAPTGHVFLKTAEQNGVPLSLVFGHEAAEQAGNPATNLLAISGRGNLVLRENCDPTEDLKYAVHVGDYLFSDFVYPCYFDPASKGPYDCQRAVKQPFQVLPGGYLSLFDAHVGVWTTLHGSMHDERAFHAAQHPYTRASRRHRTLPGQWAKCVAA